MSQKGKSCDMVSHLQHIGLRYILKYAWSVLDTHTSASDTRSIRYPTRQQLFSVPPLSPSVLETLRIPHT